MRKKTERITKSRPAIKDSWNHRVVMHTDPDGTKSFAIHEAHYRKGEILPHAITVDPVAPWGDSGNGLEWTLRKMYEALMKPLLVFETREEVSPCAALIQANTIVGNKIAREGLD